MPGNGREAGAGTEDTTASASDRGGRRDTLYSLTVTDGPLVVILAAGQGTRMRSHLPKVLHCVGGRSLIDRALDVAIAVSPRRPIVIVNAGHPQVRDKVAERAVAVVQPQPRGTGDALRSVPPEMRDESDVLVLNGDLPLLRADTVRGLLAQHAATDVDCTLLTTTSAALAGLGRVHRDETGAVLRIVEERDLPPGVQSPLEGNVGVYAFGGSRLWPALDRLTAQNSQGEFYLTDVVGMLDGRVGALALQDPDEAAGVNDRIQLGRAEAALRRRIVSGLMLSGVTVEDPGTAYIDETVRIGRDSVIRPMTVLRGATRLGEACEVGPMAQLRDVEAGDRVRIGASTLEECRIGDDVTIGHYDRVRPGAVLESTVSLGTHAEVKNSTVGAGSRINHFACVLDSDLGRDVNVGAGTVTCNFDGRDKNRTTVGDGAFIGSNSTIVAPVTIAAGAYVAAGSLVNEDVPEGALAVGRSRQRNVPDWATRRRGPRGGG